MATTIALQARVSVIRGHDVESLTSITVPFEQLISNFINRVNAMKGANVLSSVLVSVIVADSNDNEPIFDFEVS